MADEKRETVENRLKRFQTRREKLVKAINQESDEDKKEELEDKLAFLDQSISGAEWTLQTMKDADDAAEKAEREKSEDVFPI